MKALSGKQLACEYDSFGAVQVFDDGNKRYLSFTGTDEQSCVLKVEPSLLQHDYNRAMALVLLLCQPQKVMVLGLGGASLPNCLYTHLTDCQIEVVELREAVIKLAYKYFYLPHDPRLKVTCADALTHLATLVDGECDLLFSDLYIAEGFEARQLTRKFVGEAARVLGEQGWLVINALEEYRTEKVLTTLFAHHFNTLYECVTKDGNWVVIASNCGAEVKTKSLIPQAKAWSKQLGFSLLGHLKNMS